MTNLHGGVRFAFQLTKSGVVKGAEYVDAKMKHVNMNTGVEEDFTLSQ